MCLTSNYYEDSCFIHQGFVTTHVTHKEEYCNAVIVIFLD